MYKGITRKGCQNTLSKSSSWSTSQGFARLPVTTASVEHVLKRILSI